MKQYYTEVSLVVKLSFKYQVILDKARTICYTGTTVAVSASEIGSVLENVDSCVIFVVDRSCYLGSRKGTVYEFKIELRRTRCL